MKLREVFPGLKKIVAYSPMAARLTDDSVVAALFLCQLIYWQGKGKDPNGWIYKTRDEMYRETRLSRTQQETARRKLRAKGYLEEDRRGIPRKVYYKINFRALEEAYMRLQGAAISRPETHRIQRPNIAIHPAGNPPPITESTQETYRDYRDYRNSLIKKMRVDS